MSRDRDRNVATHGAGQGLYRMRWRNESYRIKGQADLTSKQRELLAENLRRIGAASPGEAGPGEEGEA